MKIYDRKLQFRNTLTPRKRTNKILLHHAAAKKCTVKQVHQWHLNQGWAGIGYHFLVRKNGKVIQGRPINTIGAHCTGENDDSIGICFEGDFSTESMSSKQLKAGQELISYLINIYGLKQKDVYRHRDFGATACPGNYFPFTQMKMGVSTLEVGDQITIKSGAKDLNTGKKYSAFVYKTIYTVNRVDEDEVVFGGSGVVVGRCLKKYVEVV